MGRVRCRRSLRAVRPLLAVVLVAGLGALVLGCGRGNFIGRQYQDLTAYYNTFYNAKQAFEKGLESINQSEAEVDRTRYLSIFPRPQSGSGGSSFDKAIKKSADLLREHPKSKWVDDALLLIGRSRYYQQNYVGAVQKFREVIALDAEREGEARFRLAQTLVAADRFAEAAEALRTGLERDESYGTWTARMRLVRGELYVRQEEWEEAESSLARGLEGELPDEAAARGAFLLGQVRETLGDYAAAQRAYERVTQHSPVYQLEFAARLGAIEMQGIHGDAEAALRRLGELEREDDTKAMRGKIAIVRARLYEELDRPQKAKQVLATVLRGEEAPTGSVQGRVHYDLATLYRDTYEDFTRAAAHFDTAATNLSSGSGQRGGGAEAQDQRLPRAPSDAGTQAERFRGLAERAQAVARMDSLLRLGRMPPSEFEAFVAELRRERLEEREQEAEAKRRRRQQFRGGARQAGQAGGRRDPSSSAQQKALQTRGSDSGFLFHRDPALVQQGRRQFEQTWGDRPLVDNWRRVNAIQGGEAATAEEGEGRRPAQSGDQEGSAQVVDVSAVPRDSASRAKMVNKLAVAQYELANALFRAAGRPDSAETWFRRILKEHEDHPVTKKALYGLAQAQRARGDTAAAENTYRRIVQKYPDTPYAKRAREQLGLEQKTATVDLDAGKADSAYARAYHTWQRDDAPERALDEFLAVAQTYPETPTAPRALLAAGVLYHRSVQRDTIGRLHTRFRRYVDSLSQSHSQAGPTGAPAPADTTSRPPADTAQGPERPKPAPDSTTAADSTTASGPPTPALSRPDKRSPEADTTAPRSARPDTSWGQKQRPQRPFRRPGDSTRAAQPDRSPHRADSARTTPSRPSPDTTDAAPPRPKTDSSRRTRRSSPDPSPSSAEREAPPDPFERLLNHLVQQYDGTPVAKRAESLLTHLKQRRAAADSAAAQTPDGSASPADTLATSSAPDTTTASQPPPRDTTAARPAPQRSPADTARGERGAPERARPDSVAPHVRDSTAVPQRGPAPSPSADTGDAG